MDAKKSGFNRRQTLTLGAAGAAGIVMPAVSSAAVVAAELPIFPEPKINRVMREIEGLSRRMVWVRTVLLNNLDAYRAWETKARGGNPEAIPAFDDVERCRLRENIVGLEIIAELTRTRHKPDRLFREIARSLGLCPEFFQVPPDGSDQRLDELRGNPVLERAIERIQTA